MGRPLSAKLQQMESPEMLFSDTGEEGEWLTGGKAASQCLTLASPLELASVGPKLTLASPAVKVSCVLS